MFCINFAFLKKPKNYCIKIYFAEFLVPPYIFALRPVPHLPHPRLSSEM